MLRRALSWMACGGAIFACTPREFFAKSPLSDVALFPFSANGKAGYVDRHGRIAIEPRFDTAGDFFGGAAEVSAGGETFWVDRAGGRAQRPAPALAGPQWVIEKGPCRLVEFNECSGKVSRVHPRNHPSVAQVDEWDLLAKEQAAAAFDRCRYALQATGTTPYVEVRPFTEGLAAVSDGERWGYVRPDGSVAIPLRLDGAGPFSGGLAPARAGGKTGYVDTAGAFVIAPRFEDALAFSEGLAPVKDGGAWRYIGRAGGRAFEAAFDQATPFAHGLAHVRRGTVHTWIDNTGKSIFTYEHTR